MNNKIVIIAVAIALLVLIVLVLLRDRRNVSQVPTTVPTGVQEDIDTELLQLEKSVDEINLGDLDENFSF